MGQEAIVRVHRPVLTDEERAQRMSRIKYAAEQLLIAAEVARRKKRMEDRNGR